MEFVCSAACLLMTILFQTVDSSSSIKRHDICKPYSQKRVYTIIGSKGIIFAKNNIFVYNSTSNDSFHEQCSLHILSCPSCMINLRFKDVRLTCTAANEDDRDRLDCDSVCIVEPPYATRPPKCVNGTATNDGGSVHYVKSSTGQVRLNFVYRHSYSHAFTAEYWITRNIQVADVKPEFNLANVSFGGYISTPFFPTAYYPHDLTFEQVIKCKLSGCTIHLIFLDFQIAEESVVEFYNSDLKRLGIAGGYTFRPPVILSSGPVLYIKFFANAGSSTGYKAQYSYIRGNVKNSILKPNTNCGGFVENRGGAITMMHMAEEFEPNVAFDCIWLFRTTYKYTYNNFKPQNLYMKVIMLKDLVESNLIVREGRTSNGRLLQWKNGSNNAELVVSIEVGYYVRLTGIFNSSSRLEIAYAAFSRSIPCSISNEFLCKNERCIPRRLQCDGFDHCGDNSDESGECWEDHDSESKYMDKSWYAYKSNYYFPNNSLYSKQYHILLGCFIGFIIFFIMVLLIIYKIAARYHFQTDFHNRLISISQLLLEDHSSSSETNRLHSLTDEPPAYEPPPDYEAPPDYDEAIQMCKALMINKENVLKEDIQSNDYSHTDTIMNNTQMSTDINIKTENNLVDHCLCCSQASYCVLALDINIMKKCCMTKMYSIRTLTIKNQI